MSMVTKAILTCDICGKDGGTGMIAISKSGTGNDAKTYKDVCTNCLDRLENLVSRIANPPKRAKKSIDPTK